MPARKRFTPAVRHSRDGVRWLAAAVLLAAFRDWAVYHSAAAVRLRALPGPRPRVNAALARIIRDPDPAEFLCADSLWHRVLEIDPDTCRALLEDGQRRGETLKVIHGHREKKITTT